MNTNEYTFASNLKDKSYQYLQQLQSTTILKAIDLIEHFVEKLYYYYSKNKYLSFRCSTILEKHVVTCLHSLLLVSTAHTAYD